MAIKLPTLKDAIRLNEEKKREIEVVRCDLEHMRKATRINCTPDQRSHRNHLQELLSKLSKELYSLEMTIAEIQWYGEEVVV